MNDKLSNLYWVGCRFLVDLTFIKTYWYAEENEMWIKLCKLVSVWIRAMCPSSGVRNIVITNSKHMNDQAKLWETF